MSLPIPDFRVLFEKTPAPLLVLSPQLQIVAVNDAYLASTMTSRDEIVGRDMFDAFPDNPADPKATGVRNLSASLRRVLRTKAADTLAVQKYDVRRPAGAGGGFEERYWSPINLPVLNADGEIEFIIHRAEDVTGAVKLISEKQAQSERAERLETRKLEVETELYRRAQDLQAALQRLAESEARFRSIFVNSVIGIATADTSGRFLEANQALLELTGYSRAELLQLRFAEITHPEDLPADFRLKQQLLSGEISNFVIEKRYLRKGGGEVWVRNMVSLLRAATNHPECLLMMTEDLTQQRRAEDALRDVSGRLLQVQDDERRRIARELHDSTAQNLAAALVHLPSEPKTLAPEAAQTVRTLVESSYRELRTLSYLLHPPWLDEAGFAPAIEWFVQGFAARTGIECELELTLGVQRLPDDVELALFRVVQEALTNVHRHSGASRCLVEVATAQDVVTLRVGDDGSGIPHSIMEKIGAGALLGVGVVGMKERVRQLGGELEISSASGGTTVQAVIPL